MSNLFMEARYAFRSLVKSPVFFITAVLTLAIGIGANTAIFSVVNTVLLKPLPYDNSDRLVLFWGELVARDVNYFPESPGNLNHYRENTSLFEDIAGVSSFGQTLTTDEGDPLRVNVGGATWNFHELLGAEVLMGRNFNEQDSVFNPEEVLPNAQFPANTFLPPKSVILSYDFWQTRFGGDPNVLGKILRLNANPVEVVGIMPDDFELYVPPTANMTTDIQIWSPLRVDLANAPTNNVFLQMMGRLKPGVTLEQAQSEINNIVEGMLETNSVLKTARFRKWVAFYEQELTREASAVIWTLMGASIFVLLIACANVANLLLVRATGRSREIAIRAAIGSSRSRLIAQMFIESALLALFAALFGVLLADLGLQAILSAAPDNVARLDKIGIDFAVLGFTLLAVAFTAMLAGTA
ncbi:MAG: ABC transporter permease, partial [Gammaproteobacteria bacterium]|nr:ABC transporter permease [Gammaproteobacteria bacterium]